MIRFALACSILCPILCFAPTSVCDSQKPVLFGELLKEEIKGATPQRYYIGDLDIVQLRKGKFCVAYYMSIDFKQGMIVYLHRLRASKAGMYFLKRDVYKCINLEDDLQEEWTDSTGYPEPDPWCDDYYVPPNSPTTEELPQDESETGMFDDQLQPIASHANKGKN